MLLGIFHDFTALVLGEVTTFSTFRTFFYILTITIPPFFPILAGTPSSEISQTRILLDFDTPTGSISQVDVQAVQLVVSHRINLLLHEVQAEEVTGYVKHHTTVFETWFVGNGTQSHLIGFLGHLQQSLYTIEQTGTGSSLYFYYLIGSSQHITFRSLYTRQFRYLLQHNHVAVWHFRCQSQLQWRSRQVFLQNLLVCFRSFHPQLSLFIYGKGSPLNVRLQRHRDNRKRFLRLFTADKSQAHQQTRHYH